MSRQRIWTWVSAVGTVIAILGVLGLALLVAVQLHWIAGDTASRIVFEVTRLAWLAFFFVCVAASVFVAWNIVSAGMKAYWLPWLSNTADKISELERSGDTTLSQSQLTSAPESRAESAAELIFWRFWFHNYVLFGGGLLLILLPLAFLAYHKYSPPLPEPDTVIAETVRLPPYGEPFNATLRFGSVRDENDSSEATLTLRTVALPAGSDHGFRRRAARGKYRVLLLGTNLDVTPVFIEGFDTRFTGEMQWRWTIAARHDGKDGDHIRYGAQDVETLVAWVVNGKTVASELGPRAPYNLSHRLASEVLLTTIAPVLSFILGVGTIVVGIFKPVRAEPETVAKATAEPPKTEDRNGD